MALKPLGAPSVLPPLRAAAPLVVQGIVGNSAPQGKPEVGPVKREGLGAAGTKEIVDKWWLEIHRTAPDLHHRSRSEYIEEQLPDLIKALCGNP